MLRFNISTIETNDHFSEDLGKDLKKPCVKIDWYGQSEEHGEETRDRNIRLSSLGKDGRRSLIACTICFALWNAIRYFHSTAELFCGFFAPSFICELFD